MRQLSGGQKTLVALALIFAIQRCAPPACMHESCIPTRHPPACRSWTSANQPTTFKSLISPVICLHAKSWDSPVTFDCECCLPACCWHRATRGFESLARQRYACEMHSRQSQGGPANVSGNMLTPQPFMLLPPHMHAAHSTTRLPLSLDVCAGAILRIHMHASCTLSGTAPLSPQTHVRAGATRRRSTCSTRLTPRWTRSSAPPSRACWPRRRTTSATPRSSSSPPSTRRRA
jgi:hypothetical protein